MAGSQFATAISALSTNSYTPSYGLDAQLFRLQFALRDVVQHLAGDEETEALIAEVDTLENGREAGHVRLKAERP